MASFCRNNDVVITSCVRGKSPPLCADIDLIDLIWLQWEQFGVAFVRPWHLNIWETVNMFTWDCTAKCQVGVANSARRVWVACCERITSARIWPHTCETRMRTLQLPWAHQTISWVNGRLRWDVSIQHEFRLTNVARMLFHMDIHAIWYDTHTRTHTYTHARLVEWMSKYYVTFEKFKL